MRERRRAFGGASKSERRMASDDDPDGRDVCVCRGSANGDASCPDLSIFAVLLKRHACARRMAHDASRDGGLWNGP